MKIHAALLLAVLFSIPAAYVVAAAPPPKAPAAAPPGDEAPPVKKRFVIHFRNGGSLETDSYTVEKGKIRIPVPSGAIYLDRSMIRDITEVTTSEAGETVQKSLAPAPEAQAPPAPSAPGETERPAQPAAGRGIPPSQPTDDQGHTWDYWKARVKEWKGKLDDAQKRYRKAEDDWNKYNGLLSTAAPGTFPEFTQNQYLDLRGAARVEMDKASADIAEAQRMLNEVIPDEARQAGAPPGWVR